MAPKDGAQDASGPERDSFEKPHANVREINPATIGLAAATAERKPNPWSKSMFRLYGIMLVGYLVSTINGYGTFARRLVLPYSHRSCLNV